MNAIHLVPLLDAAATMPEYKDWKSQMQAFLDIMEADKPELLVKFLMYGISRAKLDISADSKSTVKSLFSKIDVTFQTANAPAKPLDDFIQSRFANFEGNLSAYVEVLKSKSKLVMGTVSEVLVKQFVLEQIKPEIRLMYKDKTLSAIVNELSCISQADYVDTINVPSPTFSTMAASSSIICYNCDRPGHTSLKCRRSKVKCQHCSKLGHLKKYCRQKNTIAPVLSLGEQEFPGALPLSN